MPTVDPFVTPLLYAVPVQLLAYHTAVAKDTDLQSAEADFRSAKADVDQPRNLAKSVTVE